MDITLTNLYNALYASWQTIAYDVLANDETGADCIEEIICYMLYSDRVFTIDEIKEIVDPTITVSDDTKIKFISYVPYSCREVQEANCTNFLDFTEVILRLAEIEEDDILELARISKEPWMSRAYEQYKSLM